MTFLIHIHDCLYMEHIMSLVLNVFIYLLYSFDIIKVTIISESFHFLL